MHPLHQTKVFTLIVAAWAGFGRLRGRVVTMVTVGNVWTRLFMGNPGAAALMGDLPTARDYLGVHRVRRRLPTLRRWKELDLAALVDTGQGDPRAEQQPAGGWWRSGGAGAPQ
jgi:hypothetical protein